MDEDEFAPGSPARRSMLHIRFHDSRCHHLDNVSVGDSNYHSGSGSHGGATANAPLRNTTSSSSRSSLSLSSGTTSTSTSHSHGSGGSYSSLSSGPLRQRRSTNHPLSMPPLEDSMTFTEKVVPQGAVSRTIRPRRQRKSDRHRHRHDHHHSRSHRPHYHCSPSHSHCRIRPSQYRDAPVGGYALSPMKRSSLDNNRNKPLHSSNDDDDTTMTSMSTFDSYSSASASASYSSAAYSATSTTASCHHDLYYDYNPSQQSHECHFPRRRSDHPCLYKDRVYEVHSRNSYNHHLHHHHHYRQREHDHLPPSPQRCRSADDGNDDSRRSVNERTTPPLSPLKRRATLGGVHTFQSNQGVKVEDLVNETKNLSLHNMKRNNNYGNKMGNLHNSYNNLKSQNNDSNSIPNLYMSNSSINATPIQDTNLSIEISPGVTARLRGAKETMNAVYHDYYALTECMACNLNLGCIKDACYVLCPDCRTVSSVEANGENHNDSSSSLHQDGGVGLGFTLEDLQGWQVKFLRQSRLQLQQQQLQQHP